MRKLKKYTPTKFKAEDSTYDKDAADFAVMFIESLCHTKGTWAGKKFELIDWQEQIIRDLFGTLKPNGYRQFNPAYVEIPKKQGKSELAAAVALLLCCGDGEERAEVYGCAADRQQATIVFDVAADMVRMCPALNKRVKILASQKRIIYTPTNSFYQVLSAEAYARVSTDHEEQQSSYEAQVDYYTNYIMQRDDWEFAGLYSDEGISATNTKHRDGFNSMVQDALAGKIDLIITKSVSRFARNTVDSLSTIRKLKENGCECYFEKGNIWTFDAKGELLITIMSSLAQEESRSISENTTWGQRKRFADGKVTVPFGRFLGYDRGPDGNLVVNEEQAKTVQLIYKLFLDGYSCGKVAKKLTGLGIPTPGGKKNWCSSTVRSILTNEKYKGDALLQKVYTADFLTKEKKKNNGEGPQYYVEKNHEAIIDPRVFEQVQEEMERRTNLSGRYSGTGIFASKIKCGDCGGWFGSKVWHSNDKYRRVIYQCNHKFKNGCKCQTPHLTEDEIKEVFIRAVNQYLSERDILIENAETILHLLSDTTELEKRLDESAIKMNALVEQTENIVAENARVVLDQTAYNERYDNLISQYEVEKDTYDKLESEIADKKARHQQLQDFIIAVKETAQFQTEFDKGLWCALVDFLTVKSKDEITVTFHDGTEITVK